MNIVIKTPTSREEWKAYYDLRYKVLREPFGLPKGSEKDDYEPISQHFMAVDQATGNPVGVVKLFEKSPGVGWFSHLAVKSDCQHHGIGRLLVQAVEDVARQKGYTVLGSMIRLNSTAFMEKMGFKIAGLPAHYVGTIQAVWMEKNI